MFKMFRIPSRSVSSAITYVTVGVLLIIWASLWYFYFISSDPNSSIWQRFFCMGILWSGVAVTAIGLLFGLIGNVAKAADDAVEGSSTDSLEQITGNVTQPTASAEPPAATPSQVVFPISESQAKAQAQRTSNPTVVHHHRSHR
jgi:hypothetical protein